MPTLVPGDTESELQLSALNSPYSKTLETIAPGLPSTVESVRLPGESWAEALRRSLPFLNITDVQKQQITDTINRFAQGLPPVLTQSPTEGLKNFVVLASSALLILNLIKSLRS